MGLRFRKSKNFGPFRINISKSGIGGSVGVKGFRITKKAKGGVQATASLPGTGLSYTKNLSASKKASQPTSQNASQPAPEKSKQSLLTEFLLCLFLGYWGVHKFYKKKIGLGILYLLTLGLLGVGWLGDSILLLMALISKHPDAHSGFQTKNEKRMAQWVIYSGCTLLLLIGVLIAAKNAPKNYTLASLISVTEPVAPQTDAPTKPPTQAPTEKPTEAPTEPATQPPTEKPTDPPPTQPPTQPPTEKPTDPPTEEPTEPETDPSAVFSYVINTNTGKFHKPSCGSASKIKDENRWDYEGTRQSVVDMGYVPCGRCHP